MVTAETKPTRQCRRNVLFMKGNFGKKKVLPFENFPFLVLARNTIIIQRLIIHFSLYYLSSAFAYGRLKTQENFKPLALKVVVVAYER